MSIVVVAFVIDVLRTGDAGVGLLYGAIGVGGLVGLPVAVMVVNRTGVHGALSAGLAAWGLPLAISALAPTPIAVVALFGVIGLGNSIVDISYFAVLQRSVPDRLRSRVLGLVEAMFQGGVALGAFVGAVLLDRVGPQPALLVVGLVLPALAVGGGASPADTRPPPRPAERGDRPPAPARRPRPPADRRPRSPRHLARSLIGTGRVPGGMPEWCVRMTSADRREPGDMLVVRAGRVFDGVRTIEPPTVLIGGDAVVDVGVERTAGRDGRRVRRCDAGPRARRLPPAPLLRRRWNTRGASRRRRRRRPPGPRPRRGSASLARGCHHVARPRRSRFRDAVVAR